MKLTLCAISVALLLISGCAQTDQPPTAPVSQPVASGRSLLRAVCSAPTVTASSSIEQLWPPNKKMVPVEFSGTIDNPCAGAEYTLTDEYAGVLATGTLRAGAYAVTINLQASRDGSDTDGRQYDFSIITQNTVGTATATATVIVPHNR